VWEDPEDGQFIVKRKTIPKRLSAKLSELKRELRRRWHQPAAEVGAWLRSVVQGYFNYHAVPGNMDSLNSFRAQVIWRWYRALRRRSQRARMTWERFWSLVDRWIPSAKILHPHPNLRFDASHPRWEPYAGMLHVRICAGGAGSTSVPTATLHLRGEWLVGVFHGVRRKVLIDLQAFIALMA
jgi:RNA-directed DNA polymerase